MTTQAHTLRAARPDDAGQIADLFQLVYAESSHPCKSLEFVAQTLRRRHADVWHVGAQGDRITGCMGMLPHRWNRSWEFVRAVTHPEFRGSGLATELAQCAIDDAWASDDCDLIVGFPRSRTMYRIISEMVIPGMKLTGHDGGINIAGGRREYHLVAVSFAKQKRFARVVPESSLATKVPFVKEAILDPLDLPRTSGVYPPALITGEHPHHPVYGPFTFHYHPFCPSDSLEITAYTGPKHDPVEIADDLVRTLDSFAYVRHVRMAVLADKLPFQRALQSAGFAMTAYLPAWHLQNGIRYDCVLMTRRTSAEEPTDHGTRDLIDYFNAGYATCLA